MKFKNPFLFFTLGLITFYSPLYSPLYATSTLALKCPDRYIAEVTSVTEAGQAALFPKVIVEFKIHETQKGKEETTKTIEIIKDGPDEFKVGQSYLLETNEQWLCSAKPYS